MRHLAGGLSCRSGCRQGVTSRVLGVVVSVALVGSAPGSVPGAAAQSTRFDDVAPDSVHAPQIEGLDMLGVFKDTECGEDRFCPQEPVPRWVMAVWMVRLLANGGPDKESNGSRFADVDSGEWWAPYVERFDDLGVTPWVVQRDRRGVTARMTS